MEINELTKTVIGYAIEIHKELGPGLLESAYEHCLVHKLRENGFKVETQKSIPLIYKNTKLDCGYRCDICVEGVLIIEVKACEAINDLHFAQLLTYLKLTNVKVGLLINFNVLRLKDGIRRAVNGL